MDFKVENQSMEATFPVMDDKDNHISLGNVPDQQVRPQVESWKGMF